MNLTETTTLSSADFPVAEFTEHLRLGSGFADDGAQNALLEMCLRAAMGAIEARTGKILVARGFRWSISTWRRESGAQALPVAPITAITQLEMISADGASETIDPARYGLIEDSQRPRLVPIGAGFSEISTYGQAQISFDAGYGGWPEIPADLQRAMLMLAAGYYENRDSMGQAAAQIPLGISALIEPYKRIRIGGAA